MTDEKEAVAILRNHRLFYNICQAFVTAHKICHIMLCTLFEWSLEIIHAVSSCKT